MTPLLTQYNVDMRYSREIEANPGSEIAILYKYGAFAESIDVASFIPYVQHFDKNKSEFFLI